MKRGDNDLSAAAAASNGKQLATRPNQNKPSSQHLGQSFREHRNTFPIAGFSGGTGGGDTSSTSSSNNYISNSSNGYNSNSNHSHAGGNQSDPIGARSPVRKYSGSVLISAGSHNSKSKSTSASSTSCDKAPLPSDLSLEDYLLDVKNTMVRVGEKLELVENVTMKMNATKKDDDFGDSYSSSSIDGLIDDHSTKTLRYLDEQAYHLQGISSYLHFAPRINSDKIVNEVRTAFASISRMTNALTKTINDIDDAEFQKIRKREARKKRNEETTALAKNAEFNQGDADPEEGGDDDDDDEVADLNQMGLFAEKKSKSTNGMALQEIILEKCRDQKKKIEIESAAMLIQLRKDLAAKYKRTLAKIEQANTILSTSSIDYNHIESKLKETSLNVHAVQTALDHKYQPSIEALNYQIEIQRSDILHARLYSRELEFDLHNLSSVVEGLESGKHKYVKKKEENAGNSSQQKPFKRVVKIDKTRHGEAESNIDFSHRVETLLDKVKIDNDQNNLKLRNSLQENEVTFSDLSAKNAAICVKIDQILHTLASSEGTRDLKLLEILRQKKEYSEKIVKLKSTLDTVTKTRRMIEMNLELCLQDEERNIKRSSHERAPIVKLTQRKLISSEEAKLVGEGGNNYGGCDNINANNHVDSNIKADDSAEFEEEKSEIFKIMVKVVNNGAKNPRNTDNNINNNNSSSNNGNNSGRISPAPTLTSASVTPRSSISGGGGSSNSSNISGGGHNINNGSVGRSSIINSGGGVESSYISVSSSSSNRQTSAFDALVQAKNKQVLQEVGKLDEETESILGVSANNLMRVVLTHNILDKKEDIRRGVIDWHRHNNNNGLANTGIDDTSGRHSMISNDLRITSDMQIGAFDSSAISSVDARGGGWVGGRSDASADIFKYVESMSNNISADGSSASSSLTGHLNGDLLLLDPKPARKNRGGGAGGGQTAAVEKDSKKKMKDRLYKLQIQTNIDDDDDDFDDDFDDNEDDNLDALLEDVDESVDKELESRAYTSILANSQTSAFADKAVSISSKLQFEVDSSGKLRFTRIKGLQISNFSFSLKNVLKNMLHLPRIKAPSKGMKGMTLNLNSDRRVIDYNVSMEVKEVLSCICTSCYCSVLQTGKKYINAASENIGLIGDTVNAKSVTDDLSIDDSIADSKAATNDRDPDDGDDSNPPDLGLIDSTNKKKLKVGAGLSFDINEGITVAISLLNSLIDLSAIEYESGKAISAQLKFLAREVLIPGEEPMVKKQLIVILLRLLNELFHYGPMLIHQRRFKMKLFSNIFRYILAIVGILYNINDEYANHTNNSGKTIPDLEKFSLRIMKEVLGVATTGIGNKKNINIGDSSSPSSGKVSNDKKMKKKDNKKKGGGGGGGGDGVSTTDRPRGKRLSSDSFLNELKNILNELCYPDKMDLFSTIEKILVEKLKFDGSDISPSNVFTLKHLHILLGLQIVLFFYSNKLMVTSKQVLKLFDRGIVQGENLNMPVKDGKSQDPVMPFNSANNIHNILSQVHPTMIPALFCVELYRCVHEQELSKIKLIRSIMPKVSASGDPNADLSELRYLNLDMPQADQIFISKSRKMREKQQQQQQDEGRLAISKRNVSGSSRFSFLENMNNEWEIDIRSLIAAQSRLIETTLFGKKLDIYDPLNVDELERTALNRDSSTLPLPLNIKWKLWGHVSAILDIIQIENNNKKYFIREKVVTRVQDFQHHLDEIQRSRLQILEVISNFCRPFKKVLFSFKRENDRLLREMKKLQRLVIENNIKLDHELNLLKIMQRVLDIIRSSTDGTISIATLLPKELADFLFENELIMLSYIIKTLSDEVAIKSSEFNENKKILIEMMSRKFMEQALYDLNHKKDQDEADRITKENAEIGDSSEDPFASKWAINKNPPKSSKFKAVGTLIKNLGKLSPKEETRPPPVIELKLFGSEKKTDVVVKSEDEVHDHTTEEASVLDPFTNLELAKIYELIRIPAKEDKDKETINIESDDPERNPFYFSEHQSWRGPSDPSTEQSDLLGLEDDASSSIIKNHLLQNLPSNLLDKIKTVMDINSVKSAFSNKLPKMDLQIMTGRTTYYDADDSQTSDYYKLLHQLNAHQPVDSNDVPSPSTSSSSPSPSSSSYPKAQGRPTIISFNGLASNDMAKQKSSSSSSSSRRDAAATTDDNASASSSLENIKFSKLLFEEWAKEQALLKQMTSSVTSHLSGSTGIGGSAVKLATRNKNNSGLMSDDLDDDINLDGSKRGRGRKRGVDIEALLKRLTTVKNLEENEKNCFDFKPIPKKLSDLLEKHDHSSGSSDDKLDNLDGSDNNLDGLSSGHNKRLGEEDEKDSLSKGSRKVLDDVSKNFGLEDDFDVDSDDGSDLDNGNPLEIDIISKIFWTLLLGNVDESTGLLDATGFMKFYTLCSYVMRDSREVEALKTGAYKYWRRAKGAVSYDVFRNIVQRLAKRSRGPFTTTNCAWYCCVQIVDSTRAIPKFRDKRMLKALKLDEEMEYTRTVIEKKGKLHEFAKTYSDEGRGPGGKSAARGILKRRRATAVNSADTAALILVHKSNNNNLNSTSLSSSAAVAGSSSSGKSDGNSATSGGNTSKEKKTLGSIVEKHKMATATALAASKGKEMSRIEEDSNENEDDDIVAVEGHSEGVGKDRSAVADEEESKADYREGVEFKLTAAALSSTLTSADGGNDDGNDVSKTKKEVKAVMSFEAFIALAWDMKDTEEVYGDDEEDDEDEDGAPQPFVERRQTNMIMGDILGVNIPPAQYRPAKAPLGGFANKANNTAVNSGAARKSMLAQAQANQPKFALMGQSVGGGGGAIISIIHSNNSNGSHNSNSNSGGGGLGPSIQKPKDEKHSDSLNSPRRSNYK